MKYIRNNSDRLGMALKRVEELKQEITRLRKDQAISNIQKHCIQPRTRSCSEKSAQSPRAHNVTACHYAQATAASRGKSKTQPPSPKISKRKMPRVVVEHPFWKDLKDFYSYKDGIPLLIHSSRAEDGYMRQTKASAAREAEIRQENADRELARAMKRNGELKSPSNWPENSDDDADIRWRQYPSKPPTTPPSDMEQEDEQDTSLEERSRLHENLYFRGYRVFIDSKTGFRCLQRALEIAQEAIYTVGESGVENWRRFRGGPHEVALGRDELMTWLGEFPHESIGINGESSYTVYNSLLGVVPLRNAVCHPCGSLFSEAERIDRLVRLSQALAVVLGDEERAFEVRKLRDDLRDAENQSAQDLLDLYYMSALPYSLDIECATHHIKIFTNLSRRYSWGPGPDNENEMRILDVARVWALTKEINLDETTVGY
ncbi:hypothetical protein O1611_g1328 [Lasiodiplodia mahajangana]|uniref:Uncharacterized protein n=1 Tax=Lasiodiplodia mahajangana TaxID=1108764 RepID=A0ACC2JY09_9PEZI|nr:hypothetical protein O1611_g1328 [Lasiodiplodia mahajangana]